jgi:hypothetical protein
MNNTDKKELMQLLRKAMQREELRPREVAKCLNLNPYYVTVMLNPDYWHSAGIAPFDRVRLWVDSRLKLTEFVIPEGEEIWKAKEKATGIIPTDSRTDVKRGTEEAKTGKNGKEESPRETQKSSPTTDKLPEFKEKPKNESSESTEILPKFNYDFLNDKNYMALKEREAEFVDLVSRLIQKLENSFKNSCKSPDRHALARKLVWTLKLTWLLTGRKFRFSNSFI